MAVEITRRERSAAELRREAARAKDAKASRRMLALALVLEGRSRLEAARSCGMDRQTLRDWVHRYNAQGLEGLADRALPGRTPMLGAEQMDELAAVVEQGPDPQTDGVVRWRRVDLCEVVERRFGVRVAERTMGAILHRLGFAKLSARPRHPRSDNQVQGLYKKTSPPSHARRCLRRRRASRWRFGSKTRLASANRERSPACGRARGRARGRRRTVATPPLTSSERSAPPAQPGRLSSCPTPTPRR